MKKIGIITCLDLNNVNYGNRLQAFALNRYLCNEYGDDQVETVLFDRIRDYKKTRKQSLPERIVKKIRRELLKLKGQKGGQQMYYYGFDPTYILVLIGIVITMWAQGKMKTTFAKYSQVRSMSGMTGQEVARRILMANGIFDVTVEPVAGQLTDHYDPRSKVVKLSEVIYNSTSVAAVGVAAHECGHAIQDNQEYMPLRLRSAIVPVANLGSTLSWPMILIGIFLWSAGSYIGYSLVSIGILCFSLAVLFQLVTLPVEFDASRRALRQLSVTGILPSEEQQQTRAVLSAAALTYVAAAAASMLQLLRLVILFGGNRRRD